MALLDSERRIEQLIKKIESYVWQFFFSIQLDVIMPWTALAQNDPLWEGIAWNTTAIIFGHAVVTSGDF